MKGGPPRGGDPRRAARAHATASIPCGSYYVNPDGDYQQWFGSRLSRKEDDPPRRGRCRASRLHTRSSSRATATDLLDACLSSTTSSSPSEDANTPASASTLRGVQARGGRRGARRASSAHRLPERGARRLFERCNFHDDARDDRGGSVRREGDLRRVWWGRACRRAGGHRFGCRDNPSPR